MPDHGRAAMANGMAVSTDPRPAGQQSVNKSLIMWSYDTKYPIPKLRNKDGGPGMLLRSPKVNRVAAAPNWGPYESHQFVAGGVVWDHLHATDEGVIEQHAWLAPWSRSRSEVCE